MSKPASEKLIEELLDNMGYTINECFPILRNCINGLSKLEGIQKADRIDCDTYNDYRNILEIHSYVLYAIIEVICAFRGVFHSNTTIEKRINLKYIVHITYEFFKSIFILKKHNKSLWDNIVTLLSSFNIDTSKYKLEQSIEQYKNLYYDIDKDNRDISVHYDFDLTKLYEHLVNINEEKEARRVCDFMAIVQPLHNMLNLYSSIIVIQVQAEETSILSDSVFDKKLSDKLKDNLDPSISDSLEHFAKCLDQNMQTYSIAEKLPDNITSILGDSGIQKTKDIRDYTKLGILLHYIYLDLGVVIRGYLQSESFIEKRWNIVRINLIIYEGWKKIYLPQTEKEKSLWEQYIHTPLSLNNDESIINELSSVTSLLDSYKEDKRLSSIRHKYTHLRERKKNNLPSLFEELVKLSPYDELKKALVFLSLLSRIINSSFGFRF